MLLIFLYVLVCRSWWADGDPRFILTVQVPVVSTTLRTVARALHQSVSVSNLTATVFSGVHTSLDACREVSMDLPLAELARVRLAMEVDPL